MIRPDQKLALCYCDACGWKGGRNPRANSRPCPKCGGPVYLPHRGRGQPRGRRVVRVRADLPVEWVERIKLEGSVGGFIRRAVATRLGVSTS